MTGDPSSQSSLELVVSGLSILKISLNLPWLVYKVNFNLMLLHLWPDACDFGVAPPVFVTYKRR